MPTLHRQLKFYAYAFSLLLMVTGSFCSAQTQFDTVLARQLKADAYGMKPYY